MEKTECEEINKKFEQLTLLKENFDIEYTKAIEDKGDVEHIKVLKKELEKKLFDMRVMIDMYPRRKLAQEIDAYYVGKENEDSVLITRNGDPVYKFYLYDTKEKRNILGPIEYVQEIGPIIHCEIPSKGSVIINRGGEILDSGIDRVKQGDDGVLTIKKYSEGYYFLDANTGQKIISGDYNDVREFKEGFVAVRKKYSKPPAFNLEWEYLDKNGKSVFDKYETAHSFNEGFAVVRRFGRYSFLDKKGNHFLEDIYDYLDDFSEGKAVVMRKDKTWTFIDTTGKEIREGLKLKRANYFKEGRAWVETEDGWNFINEKGELISDEYFPTEPTYPNGGRFVNGFAYVLRKDRSKKGWYIIDKDGRFLLDKGFDSVHDFSEGMACVREKEKERFYYIDENGNKAFDKSFVVAGGFEDNLAQVYEDDQEYYYIDRSGRKLG